jgi:hypothetical protein
MSSTGRLQGVQASVFVRRRTQIVIPAVRGPSIARIWSGTALEEMTPVWRARSRGGDANPLRKPWGVGGVIEQSVEAKSAREAAETAAILLALAGS